VNRAQRRAARRHHAHVDPVTWLERVLADPRTDDSLARTATLIALAADDHGEFVVTDSGCILSRAEWDGTAGRIMHVGQVA
jgi:hypothetical protein